MWDCHLFYRANPKPLVLAQAVKLCHYTRAFLRPSAEGSSLWETIYHLLLVLLSGVSCNGTFRVTWGSRLEKYGCCRRSEGQQWCERSSKAKPWKSPWCYRADMAPSAPTLRHRLCVLSMHRKGKNEEKYMRCKKQRYEDLRKKIIQSLQLRNSGCTLEINSHLARIVSDQTRKKNAHLMLCIYYNLYVNVMVSLIFFANTISGLPQWSLCLSKVQFFH